ncbi:Trehalose transport system permease protein SugA [Hartmannibacter diazotrophicus]|uniref:Trehalose transport system permease protein SugA n=1 Tax=Hartmannibacter diazotrophicus TaxID=1482074 RepID=A0A2C9D6B7_9HYPH|nr:sugar ABC transporter permease [Hartmannibacter diazotrophicus]SON55688.1 Trehalose transport system permease protein SugA [Hartmannibacter diazotrophicus]
MEQAKSTTVPQTADGPADAAPKRLAHHKDSPWYPYLLIAPTFLTLLVVSLVPFLYMAYISLHEARYGKIRDFVWFGNFETLLTDGRFWNSMGVAFTVVGIAVPIEFMLGLIGALVLSQKIRMRNILIPFLFIPSMMAPIIVGLVWKTMLAGSWGFVSYNILEHFGLLTDTSVFASPDLALYGIIFVDIWEWTPFMVLTFFAGMQALPVNPYRAAAVDGANPVQMFFKLTLPMLSPLLVVIGMLRVIDAFKIYDTIFILTSGGPGITTESPSILGYKYTFDFWNIGQASALAVVIWAIFFVFCNIFYQVAKKRLNVF